MISAISRTSVREIRPRTLCSRRRRTVESFLLSRHHLGLSCVANAFTLSAATQLRLSNEDEGDEEGEDDERAEGQGRGRGGGAEVRMHALRESRRGWGIIKCTLPRRLMMRKRSRGVTMEAHTRRACVSREVCLACCGVAAAIGHSQGGHAQCGLAPGGSWALGPVDSSHSRSLSKKSTVLSMYSR